MRGGYITQRSVNNRLQRFDAFVANRVDPIEAVRRVQNIANDRNPVFGTVLTLGTAAFSGLDAAIARRLLAGPRSPDGTLGVLSGAENLPSVPVLPFDGEPVAIDEGEPDIRDPRKLREAYDRILQVYRDSIAEPEQSPPLTPQGQDAPPDADLPVPGASSSSAASPRMRRVNGQTHALPSSTADASMAGAGTWAERQRQLDAIALMTPEELAMGMTPGGGNQIVVNHNNYGQVFQGRRDPFVVRALEGRRNV